MKAENIVVRPRHRRGASSALVATLAILGSSGAAWSQTFNSGSTGADGAFDLAGLPDGTTVNFEPAALKAVLGRDINWDDNRFDFTTISIPVGVSVVLSARWSSGPVYWLATGAVFIGGRVYLVGEDGRDQTPSPALRRPAIPGPGGYPGGVGGDSATARPAQPGSGPGGGAAAPNATHSIVGLGGRYQANKFLVPLVGGSGGGGALSTSILGGGGAGGGAILIASSVSISMFSRAQSSIYAWGGSGGVNHGGGGGGGSIRLVAPVVAGSGYIYVTGGSNTYTSIAPYVGEAGQVRIEAFQFNQDWPIFGNSSVGSPLNSFVPSGTPPAVTVFAITTTVGNQSLPIFLPEVPTGSFDVADATINTGAPVTFEIRARGVPAGTPIDLYIQSLEGADQVIRSATPLAAFDDSTHKYTTSTTVQVTLPSGFSRGYVRAKW